MKTSTRNSTQESESSESENEEDDSKIQNLTDPSETLGNDTLRALITQLLQRLSPPSLSSHSSGLDRNMELIAIEILRLWRVKIHYDETNCALFFDFFERFLPLLTGVSTISLSLSAALFDVLERIVAINTDSSSSSSSSSSSLARSQLASLFDLCLQSFERLVTQLTKTTPTLLSTSHLRQDQLILIASLLHLLATFVSALSTQTSSSLIFNSSRPFADIIRQHLLSFFEGPLSDHILNVCGELYRVITGSVRLAVTLPNLPTVSWGLLTEQHIIYTHVLLGWMRLLTHTAHYLRTAYTQSDESLLTDLLSPQRHSQLQNILSFYVAYCGQPSHWHLISVDTSVLYAEQPLHMSVYLAVVLLSQPPLSVNNDNLTSVLLTMSAQYLTSHFLPGSESHLLTLFSEPSLALEYRSISTSTSPVSLPSSVLTSIRNFFTERLTNSLHLRTFFESVVLFSVI
jgi:hypothetical protein